MAMLEYKCLHCGGAIQYNPGTNELVCPYCDSVMDIAALQDMDEAMSQQQDPEAIKWGYEGNEWQSSEQEGMVMYSCQSCSGEIIADQTLGATSCPFCGNPVVITSKFAGMLRPDMVLPFKYGKKEALDALQKHYVGKKLLPGVFKDRNHLEEIKGVYVPFWLFNTDANVHIQYDATKIRHWSDSRYSYTETSTFRILRSGEIGFNQIPVDGSKAIDDTLMESIEPFNTAEAVDFQTAYLAGYFANKFDVDANQCAPRANDRVINSAISAFRNTVVGYNSVIPVHSNIQLKNNNVHYALLPVWLLSTSWEGKNFIFAMNGQTGKFAGDLPLDKAAYRSWLIKIFGIAAVSLLAISQLLIGLL